MLGLSAEMLATMYAVVDPPTYQPAAGSGGKRERKGVLDDMTTLPNTTPQVDEINTYRRREIGRYVILEKGGTLLSVRHVLRVRERRERKLGVGN